MSSPFSAAHPYARASNFRPDNGPVISVWIAVVVGALTIAGVVWASASQYGSLRNMVEEDHNVIVRMADTDAKNAATLNTLTLTVQHTLDLVEERTSKLETRAERNWTAIRKQSTQSEINRSAISRQGTRQDAQATQQNVDRGVAAKANQAQSNRQDETQHRQMTAETNAANAERVLSDRQAVDRGNAASGTQALSDRQDRMTDQQDIDRAAALPKKKGK